MQYVLRNAAKITYFVQTTSPFLWSEISGGKSPFASGLHRGQHSLCRLCVNGEEDVKEILTILLLKPICIHPAHTIDRCPSPKIRLKSRQCGRVSVWCSRGEIVVRFDKRGFFFTIYKISQTRHCITLAVTTNSYRIEGAEHTFA